MNENAPSQYRKQHGDVIKDCAVSEYMFDRALHLGVINSGQHSDMLHYVSMREAFLTKNNSTGSILGKLAESNNGCESSALIDTGSMADKYYRFLREVSRVTQMTLEAFSAPHMISYTNRKYWQAQNLLNVHLDNYRKWLDINRNHI